MNRRLFIQTAASTAALGIAGNALAQTATPAPTPQPVEQLLVNTAIERNHGHELKVTGLDVLKILRKTHAGKPVTIDIKGTATHSHEVTFTDAQLLALVAEGATEAVSNGATHTHKVSVQLVIGEGELLDLD